jgi:RNA polymerase sigma-70 factor, ECF subfamily
MDTREYRPPRHKNSLGCYFLSTFEDLLQFIFTNVDSPEMILSMTGRLEAGELHNPTVFERALAGDLDAFDTLMRSHERQVLGTALRLLGRLEDAQDAAQEVFIRLFRHLKKLQSAEAVGPWLYRVTVNVCNDAWQKRRPTSDVADLDLASGAPDPETLAGQSQRQRVVARGLETLAVKERAALVLREVEELSTREVAAVLKSSEVTVRTQICTARMKLRKFTEHCLRKKS